MADKDWTISFHINELPAAHCEQAVTVKAGNIGLAVNRAWAEVKKRSVVKGRRVKSGRILFYVNEESE